MNFSKEWEETKRLYAESKKNESSFVRGVRLFFGGLIFFTLLLMGGVTVFHLVAKPGFDIVTWLSSF